MVKILSLILLLSFTTIASAMEMNLETLEYEREQQWSDEEILEAIFLAEGGFKAQYLYGIRSVKYDSLEEARKICLNTIRNNRKRYKDYGYKQFDAYLEFLANRYAPPNVTNDPNNLNQYWLKNVMYFLTIKCFMSDGI